MRSKKSIARENIRANIEMAGLHIYLVQQSAIPRFAYTIGLSAKIGVEIVLAGACFFMAEEVVRIINEIGSLLRTEPSCRECEIGDLGSFNLRMMHDTWSSSLMLGALDYYQREVVHALQVVPDQRHVTIDVPDCRAPWSAESEPVWQWLHSKWQYLVPSYSTATTDIAALRGQPILEAARWSKDQWELFSGPGDEYVPNQVRIVPLGTLLAFDESLARVAEIDIGAGLLRDTGDAEWSVW